MKTITRSLSGLLLMTTALTVPAAFAQQQPTTPPSSEAVQPEAIEDEDDAFDDDELEAEGEIVVLGRNIPEPLRETAEVVAVVTAEDLARQGDDTAATALTRVAGLSLVGGRFVFVRGLGDRYSFATLNGSPLPSPEPLRRVAPLDIFPTNILENVEIQKTFSPNLSGEFGGGTIDLRTLATPRSPFLSARAGIGGNTETHGRDGLLHDGGNQDWLGYDDGLRRIPDDIQAAINSGRRISPTFFTPLQLQIMGRSLPNAEVRLIQEGVVPPDGSFEISGGTSTQIGQAEVGFIGVIGWDSEWRSRQAIQQSGAIDQAGLVVQSDFDTELTRNDVTLNGLVGLGVDWDGGEFKWTNLYIRNATKDTQVREGFAVEAGADILDEETRWIERTLYDTQLEGLHEFGPLELSWRGSYATSERNSPNEWSIRYRNVGTAAQPVYVHSASREQNRIRFSEIRDEVLSGGADVSYVFALSDERDATISAGVAYFSNTRESETRDFRLAAVAPLPDAVQQQRVDFLTADLNINPGRLELIEVTGGDGIAAFTGELETNAAYVMVDAEVIPLVRVSGGVRFEDGTQTVRPRALFQGEVAGAAAAPLDNQYWLPALTVTWNFAEDMQLRVGASKTIARPQFRELAPQIFLDIDNDREFSGNRFLEDSEIINLDARWEYYFEANQYLSVGLFAKQLTNPVETIVQSVGSGRPRTTFLNAPEALLYGVEIDVRRFFDSPLQGAWWDSKQWLVAANYTYSTSEVRVAAGDRVREESNVGTPVPASLFIRDGSQLQGQSEHLANIQFGYEDEEARSQLTALVTFVGERIGVRGVAGLPDVRERPGTLVDLVYRRGFTVFDRDFGVSLSARNILNEDYEEFQELGGARVDLNTYDLGTSFSIGLSTDF